MTYVIPYTLVVVDMQPRFKASKEAEVIAGVLAAIDQAKTDGAGIVLIESYPETNGFVSDDIINALADYERWIDKQKIGPDGSLAVKEACGVLGFATENFKVCGVNSDVCVLLTARGLSGLFPKSVVYVVKNACGSEHQSWWQADGDTEWQAFERWARWHKWTAYVLI